MTKKTTLDIVIRTGLLFLVSYEAPGQVLANHCQCNAYFGREATKRDTVNGKFYSDYTKIEMEFSDGCDDLEILKDSGDYFYIRPFYLIPKHEDKKYWLKKNTQFFVNPLSDDSDFFVLYSDHNSKSKVVFKKTYGYEKNEINQVDFQMNVLNCFNKWVKVSLTVDGKEYIGWTEHFCPLGCTTCS